MRKNIIYSISFLFSLINYGQETNINYLEEVISGIDEVEFVREKYKGDLDDSKYFVWNRKNEVLDNWKKFELEIKETKFKFIPDVDNKLISFQKFNIEGLKKNLEKSIYNEIKYAFVNTGDLEVLLEKIRININKYLKDLKENEVGTTLLILIPKEVDYQKKKPKKLKQKRVELLFLPYVLEDGNQMLRVFNVTKLNIRQRDYWMWKLIGGKDCEVCSKKGKLEIIKFWGDEDYIIDYNTSNNQIINVVQEFFEIDN